MVGPGPSALSEAASSKGLSGSFTVIFSPGEAPTGTVVAKCLDKLCSFWVQSVAQIRPGVDKASV